MADRDVNETLDARVEGACAASTAILWGALAQSLLRPTAEFAADLKSGAFVGKLGSVVSGEASMNLMQSLRLLAEFGAENHGLSDDELRLKLEVEYNRLFVGPLKLIAPPYESYYASARADGEGGRLRTQDEFDVRAAYKAAGYDMPAEFVDLPDHIAIELNFLAILARDEVDAWEAGETSHAVALQDAADDFAAEHPCRWLAQLCDRVDEGASLPVYPALLRIVRTVLGV